jgi:hypothetical protein
VIGLFGEPACMQCRNGRRPCISGDGGDAEYEATKFTERVWLLADDGYLQVITAELHNVVRRPAPRRQREHPTPPGTAWRVSYDAHTLTADDATTLTPNDA